MIKNICRFFILSITLFHVVQVFVPFNSKLLTFFTAMLFTFGLFKQGQGFRRITLIFAIIGGAILIYFKLPAAIWEQSLVSMTNIIAIIVVMQLFAIPIETGKYSDTVAYWLKRSFKKESSLYLFTMVITNIFSSFLMFGTVPIMVSLFNKALEKNISDSRRFLSTAILRGYALVLFWAPGAVIMLLVMHVTGVNWVDLFFPGILLTLIGLGTSYIFEHVARLNKPIISETVNQGEVPDSTLAFKQSLHVALIVLGLLALVSLFEHFSFGAGTGKILLAGLLIAIFWIAYYCKHPQILDMLDQHWENGIGKAIDFSVFFIAMGIFAGSIDHSGILNQMQPILQNGVYRLGLLSVIIIPVLFIGLSLVGIHPLILTVILGKILLALSLPLPLVSIALILILSASVSFIVSPFAGMAIMMAKCLEANPIDVAVKWNMLYSVLFLAEGIIFAVLWPLR